MIDLIGSGVYLGFVATFVIGLYILLDSPNLIKKVIGLNMVQVSVFFVFVAAGYVENGVPPLLTIEGPYANPLPHVIVLTAIVIGVSLTAVALALVVRLYAEFGTVHIGEIERSLGRDD